MKYILVIGDGMADNPVEELNGKTPLEAAKKPNIDAMCRTSLLGHVLTVPANLAPGSDTAILSIFGCDPNQYFSGRSPLEAAGCGIRLEDGCVSYRCNLVSLEEGPMPFEKKRIRSHSAGLSGGESDEILSALCAVPAFQEALQALSMKLIPTGSYRNIAVQTDGDIDGFVAEPPHEILDQVIGLHRQGGNENGDRIWALQALANRILEQLPINEARRKAGKLPANGIWLWAAGRGRTFPQFRASYGKTGAVISAVPLVQGIGRLLGLDAVSVPGATGELDTNYEGKVDAAVERLKAGDDFVCVHVEAPDEATHCGKLEEKLLAISYLDSRVIGPLQKKLEEMGEPYRLLLLSDHKTLMSTRGHDGDPVPFLIYDSTRQTGSGLPYSEKNGEAGLWVPAGTLLMELLFEQGNFQTAKENFHENIAGSCKCQTEFDPGRAGRPRRQVS